MPTTVAVAHINGCIIIQRLYIQLHKTPPMEGKFYVGSDINFPTHTGEI